MFIPSKDQSIALEAMHKWYQDKSKPFFYLGGYAGTGKTTLINEFTSALDKSTKYIGAAYTGKAALRMRQTGFRGAQTIHSLIYKSDRDSNGNLVFVLNDQSILGTRDLLILDECSMVDEEIGEDLLSFDVPILVLGDPGQLPPIKGTGFFTRKPDNLLTTVHRQALDSNIVRLATDVRNGKRLQKEHHDDLIVYGNTEDIGDVTAYNQIITGLNKTRQKSNFRYRQLIGIDPTKDVYPIEGERLICLKNNRNLGIFNGMIGTVISPPSISESYIQISIRDEEGIEHKNLQVHKACFDAPDSLSKMDWWVRRNAEEFDFGYTITVHKSQGSEWDNVLLIDDGIFLSFSKDTRKPWLYTGITRASKRLVIARGGVR